MQSFALQALTHLASAQGAADTMRSYVTPVMVTLVSIATLASTFFLVVGGIRYMTSSGNPEQLFQAKKILKNALIGLVLVISASALTGILSRAYSNPTSTTSKGIPNMQIMEPEQKEEDLGGVITGAIIGVFRKIIQTIGTPFISAINYFTKSTPLMAENPQVFNVWLVVVALTNVLFIVVVALLGFHVMSFQTLGFEEMDIKQMIPQLIAVFLLINSSIFAIDAVIGVSNAMISAIQSSFNGSDIWKSLIGITDKAYGVGLAGLLIMAVFLILVVMLLVYYLGRLITLYIGAVLSPLVVLLWLLPAFKDFAMTALKTYMTTIFVLFVHVIILLLAASVFTGVLNGDAGAQPNSYMALLVGIATVLALLKTQGFMKELSYAASTPRAARELGNQFMRGFSSVKNNVTSVSGASKLLQKNMSSKAVHSSSGAGSKQASKPKLQPEMKPLKTGETKVAERVKKQ
jgi:hypothetical protein